MYIDVDNIEFDFEDDTVSINRVEDSNVFSIEIFPPNQSKESFESGEFSGTVNALTLLDGKYTAFELMDKLDSYPRNYYSEKIEQFWSSVRVEFGKHLVRELTVKGSMFSENKPITNYSVVKNIYKVLLFKPAQYYEDENTVKLVSTDIQECYDKVRHLSVFMNVLDKIEIKGYMEFHNGVDTVITKEYDVATFKLG